jgi:peptide/nickel transport system substrate-binding protein
MRRRTVNATIAGLLLVLSVTPVALAQTEQETAGEGAAEDEVVMRVGTILDLANDNPWGVVGGYDWGVATTQYDMLLKFADEDLSPSPGLAEGCEPNGDHTKWTCTLREGLMWSDGTPLTSEDVAFTFRFAIDNSISVYRSYFPFNPTFETPDDRTLIWKTEQPTFAPDLPPWVYIVPKHIWKEYDGADKKEIKSAPNTPSVASGPFTLTEWERGQGWTMERNPYFWGPEPVVDRIEYRVFDNQEAMVQALKNGEIDFADALQPSVFQTLEEAEDIATQKVVSDWWLNLAFNFGGQSKDADPHPALHDRTVREAIAMAIDKQEIVDKVYLGYANPGDTIVREASTYWHLDIPEDQEIPYDPDAANAMLDEAGYVDTDGDGIREDPESGRPFELYMPASDETTGAVEAGQLIVGYLREIGMEVELAPSSDGKMDDYWGSGDFDMYIWYWSGDPDPNYQLWVFTSGQCGSWSDGCYQNPDYDALYEEQTSIFDREERREVVFEAQEFIYRDLPGVVLAYPSWLEAYRTDRFTGWTPAPGANGYLLPTYNYTSLVTVRPVEGASEASSPGLPGWVWVAGVAVIGIVVWRVATRGRRQADLEA